MARFILFIVSISLMLSLVSCKSDAQYQAEAVERARTYLLKNGGDLSYESRKFIQYNPPALLTAPIYLPEYRSRKDYHTAVDKIQVCITWSVPGETEAFMVYGTGDGSLYDWKPLRLIRRNLLPDKSLRLPANKAAQNFALNKIHTMDVEMFNFIRFANPRAAVTNLIPLGDEAIDEIKLIAGNQAKRKINSAADIYFQITLFWEDEKASPEALNGVVAVCGYSKLDFTGWKPLFGGFYSKNDFAKIIRADIDDPKKLAAYQEQIDAKLKLALPAPDSAELVNIVVLASTTMEKK